MKATNSKEGLATPHQSPMRKPKEEVVFDKNELASLLFFIQHTNPEHRSRDDINRVWKILSCCNFLQTLDMKYRNEVLQMLEYFHFEPGEDLISQGNVADAMFIMLDGEAGVYRGTSKGEEDFIRIMSPGETVGEFLDLNTDTEHLSTARALSPVESLRLSKEYYVRVVSGERTMQNTREAVAQMVHAVAPRYRTWQELALIRTYLRTNVRMFMDEQITDSVLDEVAQHVTVVTVPEGRNICEEGDESDGMYTLLKGTVEIRRELVNQNGETERVLLEELCEDDAFGEWGVLIHHGRRCATAVTTASCDLLFFSRALYMTYLRTLRYKRCLEEAALMILSRDLPEELPPQRNDAEIAILEALLESRKLVFFQALDNEGLRRHLCARLKWTRVFQGEILFNEGDFGDALYIVLRGSLGIFKRHEESKEVDEEQAEENAVLLAAVQNRISQAPKGNLDGNASENEGDYRDARSLTHKLNKKALQNINQGPIRMSERPSNLPGLLTPDEFDEEAAKHPPIRNSNRHGPKADLGELVASNKKFLSGNADEDDAQDTEDANAKLHKENEGEKDLHRGSDDQEHSRRNSGSTSDGRSETSLRVPSSRKTAPASMQIAELFELDIKKPQKAEMTEGESSLPSQVRTSNGKPNPNSADSIGFDITSSGKLCAKPLLPTGAVRGASQSPQLLGVQLNIKDLQAQISNTPKDCITPLQRFQRGVIAVMDSRRKANQGQPHMSAKFMDLVKEAMAAANAKLFQKRDSHKPTLANALEAVKQRWVHHIHAPLLGTYCPKNNNVPKNKGHGNDNTETDSFSKMANNRKSIIAYNAFIASDFDDLTDDEEDEPRRSMATLKVPDVPGGGNRSHAESEDDSEDGDAVLSHTLTVPDVPQKPVREKEKEDHVKHPHRRKVDIQEPEMIHLVSSPKGEQDLCADLGDSLEAGSLERDGEEAGDQANNDVSGALRRGTTRPPDLGSESPAGALGPGTTRPIEDSLDKQVCPEDASNENLKAPDPSSEGRLPDADDKKSSILSSTGVISNSNSGSSIHEAHAELGNQNSDDENGKDPGPSTIGQIENHAGKANRAHPLTKSRTSPALESALESDCTSSVTAAKDSEALRSSRQNKAKRRVTNSRKSGIGTGSCHRRRPTAFTAPLVLSWNETEGDESSSDTPSGDFSNASDDDFIDVHDIGQCVAMVEEGDCVGEWALLRNSVRAGSAVALADVDVLVLDKETYTHCLGLSRSSLVQRELAISILREKSVNDRTQEDVRVLESLISNNSFFSQFDYKTRAEISKVMRYKTLETDVTLFREGDFADSFYLILCGSVGVYSTNGQESLADGSNDVFIVHIGEGGTFGEWALAHDQNRSATIRTEEFTELIRVGKDDYDKVVRDLRGDLIKRDRAIDVLRSRRPEERTQVDLQFLHELIKTVDFFLDFDQTVREEVCKQMKYLKVKPDRILFQEGDVSSHLFLILRGCVGVYKDQRTNRFTKKSNLPFQDARRATHATSLENSAVKPSGEEQNKKGTGHGEKELAGEADEKSLPKSKGRWKIDATPWPTNPDDLQAEFAQKTEKRNELLAEIAMVESKMKSRPLTAPTKERLQLTNLHGHLRKMDKHMAEGQALLQKFQEIDSQEDDDFMEFGGRSSLMSKALGAFQRGSTPPNKFLKKVAHFNEDTDNFQIGGGTKKKDKSKTMLVLPSGEELDITGCVAEVREGGLIGEMGLLDNQVRNATVRTHVESELLVLDSETFNLILKDDMLRKKRQKLQALRGVLPTSSTVSEGIFDRILNYFKEETRPLRSTLVKQGERTDSVWIIIKGQCTLFDDGREDNGLLQSPELSKRGFGSTARAVGRLMRGQFIGLNSVLLQQDERHTVQVSSATVELFHISRTDLWKNVPSPIVETIRKHAMAQQGWRDVQALDRAARQAGRKSKDNNDPRREMEERFRPQIHESPYISWKLNQGLRNLDAICTHMSDHVPEELDYVRNSRNPDFFMNMKLLSKSCSDTDGEAQSANRRFNALRPLILAKNNANNEYLAPSLGSVSERAATDSLSLELPSKSFDMSKSMDLPAEDSKITNDELSAWASGESQNVSVEESHTIRFPIELLDKSATTKAMEMDATGEKERVRKHALTWRTPTEVRQRKISKKSTASSIVQGFQSVAMRRIKGLTEQYQELQAQFGELQEFEPGWRELPSVEERFMEEHAEPESEPISPPTSKTDAADAKQERLRPAGFFNSFVTGDKSSGQQNGGLGRGVSPRNKYSTQNVQSSKTGPRDVPFSNAVVVSGSGSDSAPRRSSRPSPRPPRKGSTLSASQPSPSGGMTQVNQSINPGLTIDQREPQSTHIIPPAAPRRSLIHKGRASLDAPGASSETGSVTGSLTITTATNS